ARLTKPDKPLNAYQTLIKFYPEYQDTFLPLIKEYLPQQLPQKNKTNKDKLLLIKQVKELYYARNLAKTSTNFKPLLYISQYER
ncbi:MAG: hypothetical protein IKW39_05990, partial [Alphaproteobacteria bacterium]|nr:hypothetical protein [Alphaproteobacteria bacterium]